MKVVQHMGRALRAVSLGAGLSALLAGAALADDRPVITIAVPQVVNAGFLDFLSEQTLVAQRIADSISETLIDFERQSPELAARPQLAETWTRIDEDTIELKLRPDVKFHSGATLTADDVVFSFSPERFGAADDGKGVPPELQAAAQRLWGGITVEKVDDLTVRVNSATPDPVLEQRMQRLGGEIISKADYEAAASYSDFFKAPVGTGPFKVAEFRQNEILVLDSHDEYWGGLPAAKQLRFVVVPEGSSRINGLLAGEYDFITDVMPDQISAIEANDAYEVVGGGAANLRLLVFDKHNGVMQDPRVRLAMAHAIDRQTIIDALYAGMSRIPPGLQFEAYGDMFISDWTAPEYNPDRARELLAEAGYGGETITYRILNNYYINQVATAQILAQMWKDVGINVQIEIKENWAQVNDKAAAPGAGERMVRDLGNSLVFPDPVATFGNFYCHQGAIVGTGEWESEALNEQCDILFTSMDLEERRSAFRRMLEIAEREDPVYTVLHENIMLYGKRKDIEWTHSPLFSMDFRGGNLEIVN